MKRACILLLSLATFTQSVIGQDKFNLKGEISNIPTNAKLYLEYKNANGEAVVDSIQMGKSKFFEFNGEADFSSPATLHQIGRAHV